MNAGNLTLPKFLVRSHGIINESDNAWSCVTRAHKDTEGREREFIK